MERLLTLCIAARLSGEGLQTSASAAPSRGFAGARPLQRDEVSEGSDLDDLFGDDSDADTV